VVVVIVVVVVVLAIAVTCLCLPKVATMAFCRESTADSFMVAVSTTSTTPKADDLWKGTKKAKLL